MLFSNSIDSNLFQLFLPKEILDIYELNAMRQPVFDLTRMTRWTTDGPQELKNAKPYCKKCLVDSVSSLTCSQFLNSIEGVDRCDGELIIVATINLLFYLNFKMECFNILILHTLIYCRAMSEFTQP